LTLRVLQGTCAYATSCARWQAELARALDSRPAARRARKRRAGASRRCLLAGDAHDTAAVFRLVQLWFALGADAGANAALAAALTAVPSHKLLPLAYQMASRVSAAQAGPLVESGFQARAACKRTCALISTSDHQTTVHCRAMLLFLLEY